MGKKIRTWKFEHLFMSVQLDCHRKENFFPAVWALDTFPLYDRPGSKAASNIHACPGINLVKYKGVFFQLGCNKSLKVMAKVIVNNILLKYMIFSWKLALKSKLYTDFHVHTLQVKIEFPPLRCTSMVTTSIAPCFFL